MKTEPRDATWAARFQRARRQQAHQETTAPDSAPALSIGRRGHDLPAKLLAAGRWAAGLMLFGLIAVGTTSTARAAEIVVNSNSDPSGNASQCTLREAIQSANGGTAVGGCAEGGFEDRITFNIPGTGVKTITITSPLPEITAPLTIDGYSQPGSRPNSLAVGSDAVILIELRGQGASGTGLVLKNHERSRIQGLAIRNFEREGIRIIGGGQHVIVGTFIGTDATGTVDQGNGSEGISIDQGSAGNVIGEAVAASRNVISGNGVHGIRISDAQTRNNTVRNNYIGTDASGRARIGNGGHGIAIDNGASLTLIGGADALARNLSRPTPTASVSTPNPPSTSCKQI